VNDEVIEKKAWTSPKIIDMGSVDQQTTAGTGNQGDGPPWGAGHYKAGTIDAPGDAKVVLPEGE
jgi:hypothetical protein